MPAAPFRVPKYRRHKPSNRAVVTIRGTDIYLGPWQSPESKRGYQRLVAEYLASGGQAPLRTAGEDLTVVELAARYWRYAERYYVKGDRPTRTLDNLRTALGRLRRLYGDTRAAAFTPPALKAVRQSMVSDGLSVRTCNYYTDQIRRTFRWGVSEGLLPPSVHHGLQAVPGLRRGRGEARETEPVGPVADEVVERTIRHACPVVAAMVRLQRLTGMRPAEVCGLTTGAIDTAGEIWFYGVEGHKTAHRGKVREVAIGPRAQAILQPYLKPRLDAPVFSPVDSGEVRKARMRAENVTPFTPSRLRRDAARARRADRRERAPGDRYNPDSYRRAIARACSRAFPHPVIDQVPVANRTPEQLDELARWRAEHRWHPNQLRHTKGTEVRRAFALDAAAHALGHARPDVTLIYAERTREVAARVALATG